MPSQPEFDVEQFVTIADRVAPLFEERTAGIDRWVGGSLLLSDGLCVCALCEMLDVQYLLEAGTGFGGSTDMFARYFAHAVPVVRIWSIDLAVNPQWRRLLAILRVQRYGRHVWSTDKRAREIAAERLAGYAHVTLARGDAMAEMPRMASRLAGSGARVGVVIDGPKGAEQMQLAEQLLAISPNVRFAALHDIGPAYDHEGRQATFKSNPRAVLATSDVAYFHRYSWINRGLLPGNMVGKPEHTGHGLGVLINR